MHASIEKGMSTVKDLTGGTGDVNPQLLNFTVAQTANDVTQTLEQPLPVPRIGVKKGRSIVVEVLWVQFSVDDFRTPAGTAVSYTFLLSTAAAAITVADPRTFALEDLEILASAAPDRFFRRRTMRQHFTDGAGHGFLVATDSVFLSIVTSNTAGQSAVNCKLAYRFKEVALEEYIGIVAGQQ